jgi:hypothetical protein
MLRSAPNFVKRGLAGLGLAVLGVLGILYVQELAKIDPFAALRHPTTGLDDRIGIRLEDVSLRHYHGKDLVTKAMVDRVDITRDRSRFHLYGIHDGVYRGEKATVRFASETGEWNDARRVLEVKKGTRIQSEDFDLEVPTFNYRQSKATLHVPGEIKGKLAKGVVQASNFVYNLNDRSYSAGPVHWSGELALKLQDDGNPKPTKWAIKGASWNVKGKLEVFTDGIADSGDTIIKAPHIERHSETDVVTATGGVQYASKKALMTCDKVVVYRKEKRAILTGNVQMLIKPKDQQDKVLMVDIPPFRPVVPDSIAANRPTPAKTEQQKKNEDDLRSGKSVRKYPITVVCEKIEYWYAKDNEHAVITGNPQARQDLPDGLWRHVSTNNAYYDGKLETLKLMSAEGASDTRMRNSKGDDLTMTWIQVSTKDDDDEMSAENVRGSIFGDEEDEPPALPSRTNTAKPPTKTTIKPPAKGGGSGLSGPIGGGKKGR